MSATTNKKSPVTNKKSAVGPKKKSSKTNAKLPAAAAVPSGSTHPDPIPPEEISGTVIKSTIVSEDCMQPIGVYSKPKPNRVPSPSPTQSSTDIHMGQHHDPNKSMHCDHCCQPNQDWYCVCLRAVAVSTPDVRTTESQSAREDTQSSSSAVTFSDSRDQILDAIRASDVFITSLHRGGMGRRMPNRLVSVELMNVRLRQLREHSSLDRLQSLQRCCVRQASCCVWLVLELLLSMAYIVLGAYNHNDCVQYTWLPVFSMLIGCLFLLHSITGLLLTSTAQTCCKRCPDCYSLGLLLCYVVLSILSVLSLFAGMGVSVALWSQGEWVLGRDTDPVSCARSLLVVFLCSMLLMCILFVLLILLVLVGGVFFCIYITRPPGSRN